MGFEVSPEHEKQTLVKYQKKSKEEIAISQNKNQKNSVVIQGNKNSSYCKLKQKF